MTCRKVLLLHLSLLERVSTLARSRRSKSRLRIMGFQWYMYFHPTYSSFHTKACAFSSLYLSPPINLTLLVLRSFHFSTVFFSGPSNQILYLLLRIIVQQRILSLYVFLCFSLWFSFFDFLFSLLFFSALNPARPCSSKLFRVSYASQSFKQITIFISTEGSLDLFISTSTFMFSKRL